MTAQGFQDRFQAAMGDVSKLFERPVKVLHDGEFTPDQKRKLLKQWEYDLREMQVAADENMTGPKMDRNDEILREVRDCLGRLGDEHAPERSASHTQGG